MSSLSLAYSLTLLTGLTDSFAQFYENRWFCSLLISLAWCVEEMKNNGKMITLVQKKRENIDNCCSSFIRHLFVIRFCWWEEEDISKLSVWRCNVSNHRLSHFECRQYVQFLIDFASLAITYLFIKQLLQSHPFRSNKTNISFKYAPHN